MTENSYNELSQLKNKKVGNNLQSIDYTYNIRGWMTDINKDQMSLPDLGGKLFSYKIKYTQKEGIENPDQAQAQFSGKNVKAKYNGNIAEVDWRAVENIGNNPSTTPKRYGYVYDGLNRLTAGYYQNPNNPNSKENTESLNYDLNGNITNLYRTSVLESGTNTAMVIDDLGYVYGTGGNQVTNINDISQNFAGYEGGGSTIGYDLNGNMTSMPDKGISTIKYNFLNLPNNMMISKNGNENIIINTKYRADGTKLRKENTTDVIGFNGSVTTINTTDYLDGFQYLHSVSLTPPGGGGFEMLAASALSRRAMEPQAFSLVGPVDTDPTIDPPFGGGGIIVDVKTPDLQFFPTTEGFYDYQKNQYIYQYEDHLGNARVSFARNSAGALEITAETIKSIEKAYSGIDNEGISISTKVNNVDFVDSVSKGDYYIDFVDKIEGGSSPFTIGKVNNIGDSQSNRVQIISILGSGTGEVAGHEFGHTLGLRHKVDPNNPPNIQKSMKFTNLMNSQSTGLALTPEQLSEIKKNVPITPKVEVENNQFVSPINPD